MRRTVRIHRAHLPAARSACRFRGRIAIPEISREGFRPARVLVVVTRTHPPNLSRRSTRSRRGMATRSGGPDMKRMTTLAALVTGLAASLAATAPPADAAVSSASIVKRMATLNLDGADDSVTVSVSGGLLVHGQTTGGLASGS